MNPPSFDREMDAHEDLVETEALSERGFTLEEIASLLRLREWYQQGGSDRVVYCFPPSAPPGLLDIVAEQANDVREGRVETSAHHAVRSMLALPSLVNTV